MKMGEKQKDATAEEEEEEMEGQPTTISRRRRDVTSTPIISRALRQTQPVKVDGKKFGKDFQYPLKIENKRNELNKKNGRKRPRIISFLSTMAIFFPNCGSDVLPYVYLSAAVYT